MINHPSNSAMGCATGDGCGVAVAVAGETAASDRSALGQRIMDLVLRLRRAHLRSKTILALLTLDERTLKDIGVQPHDIPWIAECLVRADNDNWRKPVNDNERIKSA